MDYKYTGIVLAKRDVGETDRLYTIYTLENGKIQALAKGVRKAAAKLAGSLETLTLADVAIAKNQGTGKITSVIPENNFSELKNSSAALGQALSITRQFNRLVGLENKDEKLFHLLLKYLELLSQVRGDQEKRELISTGFLFQFLEKLGYGVEVSRCVVCGEPLIANAQNRFSAEQGGIIGAECLPGQGIPVSANVIKLLRLFFQNNLSSLVKIKTGAKESQDLKRALNDFLAWVGK